MKIPKKITCLSCLKSFSKREVIGKLCIEEVRVDLEHLCSCSWKQCRIFHGSFSVNNYPLVYIHCIIKIMCQALVLGWLDCLFTLCGTKIETLAVVREFTFFYWKVKWVWKFLHITSVQIFLIFICVPAFLELQKFAKLPDYYRLSCLRQILFLMHCLLVLMKLSISISGLSHGKVILR